RPTMFRFGMKFHRLQERSLWPFIAGCVLLAATGGVSAQEKQDYDKAIADYTAAIGLDPTNASAYQNRGFNWSQKHDYDKAIADYTEAIRLDPTGVATYYHRGMACFAKENYEMAISDFNEVIRLRPNSISGYQGRGQVWVKKGE